MKTISANGANWLDVQNPTEKDLAHLKEQYGLHPMIEQQFLPPIHRPKVEEHPDQLFVVLHFPVYDTKEKQTKQVELDIIITPKVVITAHQGEIPSLGIFLNDCEVQKYHKDQYFKNTGILAFSLLDFMIDSILPMLDHVAVSIDEIEKEVFSGHEREVFKEIARIKKDLIDFRRAIKPQRSVLELLDKKCQRIYGKGIKQITQEVIGSNIRVWNVLENHQELINSLEQTSNSLLSNKLGEIMKVLTIVSFITFPLAVVAGFFGMNVFEKVPMVRDNPFAWLIILAVMLISASIMYVYFRIKKWL